MAEEQKSIQELILEEIQGLRVEFKEYTDIMKNGGLKLSTGNSKSKSGGKDKSDKKKTSISQETKTLFHEYTGEHYSDVSPQSAYLKYQNRQKKSPNKKFAKYVNYLNNDEQLRKLAGVVINPLKGSEGKSTFKCNKLDRSGNEWSISKGFDPNLIHTLKVIYKDDGSGPKSENETSFYANDWMRYKKMYLYMKANPADLKYKKDLSDEDLDEVKEIAAAYRESKASIDRYNDILEKLKEESVDRFKELQKRGIKLKKKDANDKKNIRTRSSVNNPPRMTVPPAKTPRKDPQVIGDEFDF